MAPKHLEGFTNNSFLTGKKWLAPSFYRLKDKEENLCSTLLKKYITVKLGLFYWTDPFLQSRSKCQICEGSVPMKK